MKKTYLAPTSETLSTLIFSDICDAAYDPNVSSSNSGVGGNPGRPAPRHTI